MTKEFHDRQREKVILVAEDNTNDFKLLEYAYSQTGLAHRLQHVRDGLDVVSYLEGLPPYRDRRRFPLPDLLLLDLDMPGMYGFQVLEWLRNCPDWSKLPVVVLSCSNSDHDREKAYELGARAFYTKDASREQTQEMLLNICREWLGSPSNPPDRPRAADTPGEAGRAVLIAPHIGPRAKGRPPVHRSLARHPL